MPWRDGGGVTTEIAIDPAAATVSSNFTWRLSSARVEASGPFSRFPGCLRDLVLLEGAGFELTVGSRTFDFCDFLNPVRFSGDDSTRARLLQGPSVDLGLIWDPHRIRAEVSTLRVGEDRLRVDLAPTTLLVAPGGGIVLESPNLELGVMDTLRFDGVETDPCPSLRATMGSAPLVVIRMWPSP